MKQYNLFQLDINKDKPSFENESTKLWLLDNEDDFKIFRTICTNGFNGFVLFDEHGPIYDSISYESVCVRKMIEKRLCL